MHTPGTVIFTGNARAAAREAKSILGTGENQFRTVNIQGLDEAGRKAVMCFLASFNAPGEPSYDQKRQVLALEYKEHPVVPELYGPATDKQNATT